MRVKDFRFKNDSQIKDIDRANRVVQVYLSKFGNVDSDGDVIRKGAYAKTIQEWGPEGRGRIKHLYQHMPTQIVGKYNVLREDDFGLYAEAKILKTALGDDVLEMYNNDMLEHSVGFEVKRQTPQDNYNEITEIKLYEGSAVTWGANMDTPLVGMKSEASYAVLADRMEKLEKAFRDGSFTDDTFHLLELELAHIRKQIEALPDTDSPSTDTNQDVTPDDIKSVFASFEMKQQLKLT